MVTETEQNLTYEHADGVVHEVNNLDNARELCPVLGSMTVERAGILLEMARRGKELREKQEAARQAEEVGTEASSRERNPTEHNEALFMPKATQEIIEAAAPVEHVAVEVVAEEDLQYSQQEQVAMQEATRIIDQPAVIRDKQEQSPSFDADLNTAAFFTEIEKKQLTQIVEEIASDEQLTPDSTSLPMLPEVYDTDLSVTEKPNEVERSMTHEVQSDDSWGELIQAATVEEPEDSFIFEPVEDMQASVEKADMTEHTFGILPEITPTELRKESFTNADELLETELPVSGEEVADIMDQIIEVTSQPESETVVQALETIEKILRLPVHAEISKTREPAELEVELKELVVELLEGLDIDYTPEHVDALILLARHHYFDRIHHVTKELAQEESSIPKQLGTREFLQKLQHGIKKLNWQVLRLYKIGNSALHFYGFQHSQL